MKEQVATHVEDTAEHPWDGTAHLAGNDGHPWDGLTLRNNFDGSQTLHQTTDLRLYPLDTGDLGLVPGGNIYASGMLGELFPEFDLNQVTTEADATHDVVNKTVRMEDDQITTKQHPKTPTTPREVSYCQPRGDMVCFNCGKKGHTCSACPNRSHLSKQLNLSPSHLHHFRQRSTIGDGTYNTEAAGERSTTSKLDQMTDSFRVLRSHGGLKTKAAMKEFPPALSFPCSIQRHPRRNTESQDQKSAEHNN